MMCDHDNEYWFFNWEQLISTSTIQMTLHDCRAEQKSGAWRIPIPKQNWTIYWNSGKAFSWEVTSLSTHPSNCRTIVLLYCVPWRGLWTGLAKYMLTKHTTTYFLDTWLLRRAPGLWRTDWHAKDTIQPEVVWNRVAYPSSRTVAFGDRSCRHLLFIWLNKLYRLFETQVIVCRDQRKIIFSCICFGLQTLHVSVQTCLIPCSFQHFNSSVPDITRWTRVQWRTKEGHIELLSIRS